MRERIYSPAKILAALEFLREREIDTAFVFKDTGIIKSELFNEKMRVSSYQMLRAFKNICVRNLDPYLPYEIGRSVHLSAYGLFGYAILCSTSYRDTVEFAQKYRYLAAPTSEIVFEHDEGEEGWGVEPIAAAQVDKEFYAFLVNLQMGVYHSLHQDVMGGAFYSNLIELRYDEDSPYKLPKGAAKEIRYGADRNRFHVPKEWLDHKLELGNELTFKQISRVCDAELSELVMQDGVTGQVRKVLVENVAFASNMDVIAENMGMTSRTLRRHLKLEKTTFSEIVDSTRTELALRYLRAAELSTEEIAYVLGFSETASFVRAFKRWTGKTPKNFRMAAADQSI